MPLTYVQSQLAKPTAHSPPTERTPVFGRNVAGYVSEPAAFVR